MRFWLKFEKIWKGKGKEVSETLPLSRNVIANDTIF